MPKSSSASMRRAMARSRPRWSPSPAETMEPLSRRHLRSRAAALAAAAVDLPAAGGEERPAGGIERIEHLGMLISECSVPGERRQEDVVPAHPNAIRVSKDRWLLVYATRGFRG